MKRTSLALCVVLLAASAFAQRRTDVEPMSKGTLNRIQDFLRDRIGSELLVLDPSLEAIAQIDPDNRFQREALGLFAAKLGDKDEFKAEIEDPAKAQQAALRIIQANRDPENLAFISAKITERLAELEGLKKKDRRDAATELAPLVRYARPIHDLSGLIERARKTADSLGVSHELGVEDEAVRADENDPSIVWRPILDIGPMGQFGTGKREVGFKAGKLGALSGKKLRKYLAEHPIPVFRTEKGRLRVFKHGADAADGDLPMDDHHHLLDAVQRLGVTEVATKEIRGASASKDVEKHIYPFDAWGNRRSIEELPRNVYGLGDFPYRSVAWLVRELGGFPKQPIPYLEMYVGEQFRQNLKVHPNVDFYGAVMEAMQYTRTAKFQDWFQRFVASHR